MRMAVNYVERHIKNLMKHYFEYKAYFPKELYDKAKQYLQEDKNPFLYMLKEMQSRIENTNYALANEVFGFFLQNDRLNDKVIDTLIFHAKNEVGYFKYKRSKELYQAIKLIDEGKAKEVYEYIKTKMEHIQGLLKAGSYNFLKFKRGKRIKIDNLKMIKE